LPSTEMPTSNIIRILTGALLIALLLFLGWGIHDAASFFSSAARTAFLH